MPRFQQRKVYHGDLHLAMLVTVLAAAVAVAVTLATDSSWSLVFWAILAGIFYVVRKLRRTMRKTPPRKPRYVREEDHR